MQDVIALIALSVVLTVLVSMWRATSFSERIDRRVRRRQHFTRDAQEPHNIVDHKK